VTELPGTWNEPDTELLDGLTHNAMFAASGEAMKPGPPSSIRTPDGWQQGETPHEHTKRVVRAALRMLLANGLITVTPADKRPKWVVLDPPEKAPEQPKAKP
jgi:hypothetical protein